MSKSLHVNLLGELEVRRGTTGLDLPPSKKARALLAYLVATGRPHRRSRLCNLLWDVADDPRGALRWCLSKIRPLLDEPGQERLVADRESVRFEASGAEVDLLAVERLVKPGLSTLSVENLEGAAARFRGEFLEGLELLEYHDFQAWCTAMREEARALQVSVLAELVSRLGDDTDGADRARKHASMWVAADPLSGDARTALVRVLARGGRFREAEEALRAGRSLMGELGGEDSQALVAAEHELRTWRAQTSASPSAPPSRAMPVEEAPLPGEAELSALVGRQRECSRLAEVLEGVGARRREAVVLLRGEPGVGKSRTIAEMANSVRKRRGTVLEGRAYEVETSRPYGPWIDALSGLHGATVGGTLAPELAPLLAGGDLDREGRTRDRFFAAVVELIAARAHSAPPVLLCLDDLHWCDDASIELLHYVLRMNRHRPLLVLLAAREGELPDNETAQRMIRGLRRDGFLEEIGLDPLGPEETAALVRAIAPEADAERIFRQSAGNPLFALEMARAAPSPAADVGRNLAELVRDRIDRLSSGAGDVIRWASVLGGAIDPRLLAEVVASDFASLMGCLALLERHRLLRATPPAGSKSSTTIETYVFAHDLVRQVVYRDLSDPRRRLMHDRVAEILARRLEAEPRTAPELARHASLGSDRALAARACIAAGRHSLSVFANREAIALARRGIRHAESLGEPEKTRIEIEAHEVELSARRPSDPEGIAARLEFLAGKALEGGEFDHARLGFHLLSYLRWEGGDWSSAHRQMLRAEQVGRSGDDRAQVRAMAEAARCLALLERDLGNAEAMALEARGRAQHAGIEATAIPHALGMLHLHRGEWEEAAEFFRHARSLYLRDGDRVSEFQALEHLVVLEVERGRPKAALALTEELRSLAAKLREGSDAPSARALSALAAIAVNGGDQDELDRALDELRVADAKHRLAYALNRAALLDLKMGELDRGRRRAGEAADAAAALDHPTETAMANLILLRIAEATGDGKAARIHREALGTDAVRGASARVRQMVESTINREGS